MFCTLNIVTQHHSAIRSLFSRENYLHMLPNYLNSYSLAYHSAAKNPPSFYSYTTKTMSFLYSRLINQAALDQILLSLLIHTTLLGICCMKKQITPAELVRRQVSVTLCMRFGWCARTASVFIHHKSSYK